MVNLIKCFGQVNEHSHHQQLIAYRWISIAYRWISAVDHLPRWLIEQCKPDDHCYVVFLNKCGQQTEYIPFFRTWGGTDTWIKTGSALFGSSLSPYLYNGFTRVNFQSVGYMVRVSDWVSTFRNWQWKLIFSRISVEFQTYSQSLSSSDFLSLYNFYHWDQLNRLHEINNNFKVISLKNELLSRVGVSYWFSRE